MIINDDNVFFFANEDKHNLQENQIIDLHKSDFSIYCRFKPDHSIIDKKLEENDVYNGGILVKNGKHFGIFFNAFKKEDKILRTISFTFWSYEEKLGDDVQHAIEFYYAKEDRYYDVILNHNSKTKEFTLREGVELKTVKYDNVIDYSTSFTWLGAANLLADDHQSIFYGDIDKIHIQNSMIKEEHIYEFFDYYPTFIAHAADRTELNNVFSSDFQKTTYYKILDMSGNGNHPVKFKKEWII